MHFKNWVVLLLHFKSSSCIFNESLLYVYVTNISSQTVAYIFTCLTVSFTEHIIVLIKFNLSRKIFNGLCFCYFIYKLITKPQVKKISPVFALRSFIVLQFTSRSTINFQLIFMKGLSSVSKFTYLHIEVQFSQCHLLKRLSSLH